jgi:hypothetical protein
MGEAVLRFRIFISSFSFNLVLFLQEGGRNNALDIAFELLTLLKVLSVVETVFLSCQDVGRGGRMARLVRGGLFLEFAF